MAVTDEAGGVYWIIADHEEDVVPLSVMGNVKCPVGGTVDLAEDCGHAVCDSVHAGKDPRCKLPGLYVTHSWSRWDPPEPIIRCTACIEAEEAAYQGYAEYLDSVEKEIDEFEL